MPEGFGAPGRSGTSRARLALLFVAAAAVTAVDVVWIALHLGGPIATAAVDDLLSVAAAAVAVWIGVRRARNGFDGGDRYGWLLLGVSCAGLGAGDSIYSWYDLVLKVPVPYPSWADAAYLSGTVLGIPAVLLVFGPTWREVRFRLLLDGAIVAIALLLLSWLTVLEAVYHTGGENLPTFALGLAYPVGDIITVVIVLFAVSFVRQSNPAALIVALGILFFAISDSAYSYLSALGLYEGSNVIDAGYVAGYLAIAIAAGVRVRPDPELEPQIGWWQVLVPYVPLVAAGVVVVVRIGRNEGLDVFDELLITLLIALVLVRQLATVVEGRQLSRRLSRTVDALQEALEGWKAATTEREVLIQHAPVGICRMDLEGNVLDANLAAQRMFGYTEQEVIGRSYEGFLHAGDRDAARAAYSALEEGRIERVVAENRFLRRDGTTMWCSQVATTLRDAADRPESFLTILEDITERKLQAQRAARIQRQLLPESVPEIAGFELAGVCHPAEDVAGDFYDWVMAEDGCLDVTVADVMGKGVGAALVNAVMRTALRSASPALGPAERVRIAAASLAHGMGEDGLFVTLFHARLDTATGDLRYVDAGHGYCAIVRAGGELVRLPVRSLPLGVREEERFAEGAARLEPGDSLVVYSDGLVEREVDSLDLAQLVPDLDGADDAAEMVGRLMAWMPPQPADDVTVLVLRRLPGAGIAVRSATYELSCRER